MANENFTLPESLDALSGAEAAQGLFETLKAADLTDIPTEALATFLGQIDAKTRSLHAALMAIPEDEISGPNYQSGRAEVDIWSYEIRPLVLRGMTFGKLQAEANATDNPGGVYQQYLPKMLDFKKLGSEQGLRVDGELLSGITFLLETLDPQNLMHLFYDTDNHSLFRPAPIDLTELFRDKIKIEAATKAGLVNSHHLHAMNASIVVLIRKFSDAARYSDDMKRAQDSLGALSRYLQALMKSYGYDYEPHHGRMGDRFFR